MYEFQCTICEKIVEKLAAHDIRTVLCDCGQLAIKVHSPPGIVFQKRFYPRGKDWNNEIREAWEPKRKQKE